MSGYYPVNPNQGYPSYQPQPPGYFPRNSSAEPQINNPVPYPVNSSNIPYPTYPQGDTTPLLPYPNFQQHLTNQPKMMPGEPSQQGYPVGYPNQANPPVSQGYPSSNAGIPAQVCPTAPDLNLIEKIPGYEHLTFDEEILKPPSVPVWQPDQQQRREVEGLPSFTEEQAREAAIQFASEHCCYGSGVVRDMAITDIKMMSAFHYKLETFGEKRESAWRFVPYNGHPIDGPMNGPAPAPWDVTAIPSQYFKDDKAKLEVPHTAFVKPCHTCVGNGRIRCDSCFGNGNKQCTWCNGRGYKQQFNNDEMCTSCNGTGHSRCFTCSGSGQVQCKTCSGKGNLKGFVELIITWSNHVDDYISETSSMPKELVREVTGKTAYEEENPRVWPIMNAPDQAVNGASNELVTKHNSAFPNERILKQRQCLRLIPIAEVSFNWKDRTGIIY